MPERHTAIKPIRIVAGRPQLDDAIQTILCPEKNMLASVHKLAV